MNHETRQAQIVKTLRKKTVPGWHEYDIPRIGKVVVSCMPVEMAKQYGNNECWVRVGTVSNHRDEFRGSAEAVAKELCKLLRAPSKTVEETAAKVLGSLPPVLARFGFKAYELAAMKGLDIEATFQALDLLAERGQAVRLGDQGWFRA